MSSSPARLLISLAVTAAAPAVVSNAIGNTAAVLLGVGNELDNVADGQFRVRGQHLRAKAAHHRNRHEVLPRIIGKTLEGNEIDRHARGVGEQKRMSIRRGASGGLMCEDPGCSRHVLDDHGLADLSRQSVTQQPCHHVCRGAGPGRHDKLHWPAWPRFSVRWRHEGDRDTSGQRAKNFHHDGRLSLLY